MTLLSRIYFVILMGLWTLTAQSALHPQPAFHGHPTIGDRIFYDARTYSATDAAFLSTDPANKSASGYTLSIANPTHYIDPTGKSPINVTELAEVLEDVIGTGIAEILAQPELDDAAIADLTALQTVGDSVLASGLGLVEKTGKEAEAIALTFAESSSENLAAASSNLGAIEGALENMAGGVPEPEPDPLPEEPEPVSPNPTSSVGTDAADPAAPMENTPADEEVGRSPAQTLEQGTQSDNDTKPQMTLNEKLISWTKGAAKMAVGQAVALGGMYEVTKLTTPAAPKKPIPKQK